MNTIPPLSPKSFIVGALLGLGAIGLFAALWLAFGDAAPLARMVIAVCVPPLALTLAFGGFLLWRRGQPPPAA